MGTACVDATSDVNRNSCFCADALQAIISNTELVTDEELGRLGLRLGRRVDGVWQADVEMHSRPSKPVPRSNANANGNPYKSRSASHD